MSILLILIFTSYNIYIYCLTMRQYEEWVYLIPNIINKNLKNYKSIGFIDAQVNFSNNINMLCHEYIMGFEK
jgi:competence transcription factor ComK